jgi:hypothetical protein
MPYSSRAAWIFIGCVGIVDAAWMYGGGLRMSVSVPPALILLIWLAATVPYFHYSRRRPRTKDCLHFVAQFLALSLVELILNYIVATNNAPLIDAQLDALDKALGLDWLQWFEWVEALPAIQAVLWVAYATLNFQPLVVVIYCTYRKDNARAAELWWTNALALSATILISGWLPAASAWVFHGVGDRADIFHFATLAALRDGTMRTFDLAHMYGLVTFPSYHTTLAILVTYALRNSRGLFLAALGVNTLLIASVPTVGGHYFIDAIAGAAMSVLAILVVRSRNARASRLPYALPLTAMSREGAVR